MMDYILPVLAQLVVSLPTVAAWIVGMVIAVRRKSLHPNTSTLTLIAGGGAIFQILSGAFTAILPMMMRYEAGRISRVYAVVGGIQGLVHAALVAVMLMAIFGEREIRTPSAIPGAPSV
jgi:hypothetical protein